MKKYYLLILGLLPLISYSQTYSELMGIVGENDFKKVTREEVEELKKELMKLHAEKFNVTYSEWEKKKLPNYAAPISTKITVTHTIQEFLKKFIPEVDVS